MSLASARLRGVSTVPMPTDISGTSAMTARAASTAAGVLNAISMVAMPPFSSARASGTASSASAMVMTGMTGDVLTICIRLSSRELMRKNLSLLSRRALPAFEDRHGGAGNDRAGVTHHGAGEAVGHT